jgi:hypothetical protein
MSSITDKFAVIDLKATAISPLKTLPLEHPTANAVLRQQRRQHCALVPRLGAKTVSTETNLAALSYFWESLPRLFG